MEQLKTSHNSHLYGQLTRHRPLLAKPGLVVAGRLTSRIGDYVHLRFRHAMFVQHVLAQIVHRLILVVTDWTARQAVMLLHVLKKTGALGVPCSTDLAYNRVCRGEGEKELKTE